MPVKASRRPASRAPQREDGAQTRQQLLEAAGELFAEQGFAAVTSKEVCARAQTNIAAVNYHFGSKDGLYAAVLEEAHARLVSIEFVTQATQGTADPAEKLRILLTQVVSKIVARHQDSWALRVLSREVASPTSLLDRMITSQVQPKFKLVGQMIAGILEVPATHPAVARSMLNIIGPCAFLLISSHDIQRRMFPAQVFDPDALVDHMITFAIGGLTAVRKSLKASAAPVRLAKK